MALARLSSSSESGFSLMEVMVSIGLLTAVALSAAQLFATATTANFAAKSDTSATLLAVQKMEQLRGLTWGFDEDPDSLGLPVSDTTTNLSVHPPTSTGNGLNPSPAGTLENNMAGYVDFLDRNGEWVGTGQVPPPDTHYVRRWSIRPLPTNPNNTLIFTVMVTTLAREAGRDQGVDRGRQPGDAWLVTLKTRKAR